MKLFLAAVYTNEYAPNQKGWAAFNENEVEKTSKLPNILESYHYVYRQRYVDAMRENGAKIFLDSGAFSAFTLGVKIDLPLYCHYIRENRDIIRREDGVYLASVLDGIGDPLETYRNQLAMEELGAKPLPCFHYGEDERYLEYYIKNYPYITIGGMVGKGKTQLIKWLDRIWGRYLLDGSGNARIKAHGFGITTSDIMERYPWYSCDSSSWIQATSFGRVDVDQFGRILISDKHPSRQIQGQHLTTFSEPEQAAVRRVIANAGFDEHRLATVYQSRAAFNLWAYNELGKRINRYHKAEPFNIRAQELF